MGAGVGATFHSLVRPQAGLGGCHGCGFHSRVQTRPIAIPIRRVVVYD
jgi:hypothetical protein